MIFKLSSPIIWKWFKVAAVPHGRDGNMLLGTFVDRIYSFICFEVLIKKMLHT